MEDKNRKKYISLSRRQKRRRINADLKIMGVEVRNCIENTQDNVEYTEAKTEVLSFPNQPINKHIIKIFLQKIWENIQEVIGKIPILLWKICKICVIDTYLVNFLLMIC